MKKGNIFIVSFFEKKSDAIVTLHTEYKSVKWGKRILGFFLMWIGIRSMIAIVRVVVRFIPIVGGITRVLLGGISFVIAMILTYVAVALGAIAYSWIVLVVVAGLLSGLFILLWKKKKSLNVKEKL